MGLPLPPHKVRISFELDLTDFPGVRPDDKTNIEAALQNLGSWLGNLQQFYSHDAVMWSLKQNEDMYQHMMRQSKLAGQIFDNHKVEGALADGTQFVFTHKEPGYEESLIYANEPHMPSRLNGDK